MSVDIYSPSCCSCSRYFQKCGFVHVFEHIFVSSGVVTVSVVDEMASDLSLFLSNSSEPISGQLHEQFIKM